MTRERAHKIYDVLVKIGGASESMRESFVYHHVADGYPEWRFSGKLGFGGKYYARENQVGCYSEDYTPAREQLIKDLNAQLASVSHEVPL